MSWNPGIREILERCNGIRHKVQFPGSRNRKKKTRNHGKISSCANQWTAVGV